MLTTQIENLSAAELKAERAELAQAIAANPPEELAARYVQARLDAKIRDEKLAEQAATLRALEQGLAAATERVAALSKACDRDHESAVRFAQECDDLREKLEDQSDAHAAKVALLQEQHRKTVDAVSEELAIESDRSARLKLAAARMHAAGAAAAKALNDALSAQAIDAADQG